MTLKSRDKGRPTNKRMKKSFQEIAISQKVEVQYVIFMKI